MSIVAIETRVAIVAKEDCRARKLASMAIFSRMTWISLLQKKKGEEKGRGGLGGGQGGWKETKERRGKRTKGKGRRKKDKKKGEEKGSGG